MVNPSVKNRNNRFNRRIGCAADRLRSGIPTKLGRGSVQSSEDVLVIFLFAHSKIVVHVERGSEGE